jgi:hypothetical protein
MLRHRRRYSEWAPVAAEVLEIRDLLSSAAAAVHGATHHAAIQQPPDPAAQLAPRSLHATVQISFTVEGGIAEPFTGQLTLSKVKQTIGAHVTAHISISSAATGNRGTVKGSFVGTIANIGVNPQGNVLTITPTGGSVIVHQKKPGLSSTTAKAVPNGTATTLVMAGDTFVLLDATDVFTFSAPPDLAGKTVLTEIKP